MTTTPAGNEPNRPTEDGPLAPTAPGKPLTRPQKTLIAIVAAGVLTIATLGFIGSYTAVTDLATTKGFGDFAHAFPIAIDAGIIAFLALDLLLTWLRMPYPLLRHGAWLLTAATIAFNAAAAWPDWLGVGMHAVIPVLFVVAVEAARHAIGRIADITADKHIEGPPISRWLLNPPATFILWRRQRMWGIRSWDAVVDLERERRIYRAKLRKEYGRAWRRKANADQLLVLRLTADGMSVQDAIELPLREAEKQAEAEAKREAEARAKAEAEAEAKHQAELRKAEAEAKRRAEVAEAEAAEARARAEAEAAAEAARLEVEAKRRAEAEAARLLVAETEAKLAEIARQQREAEAEADLNRKRRAAEQARLDAEAARQAQEKEAAQAQARREQEARERAQRIAAQASTASASASGTGSAPALKRTTTSGSASGSVSTLGGRGAKKQAEVEAVLARLVEAGDPKAYPLAEVMADFGLTQTTAYDRLVTAQRLYADSQNPKSEKTA
ncbi:hypothetical protein GCM10018777_56390 [Streptomyces albogriseolus]|uniref:DUF2637 domain-containing protein n=2 Tax=Streptomyces TaxID=1883 RepID=UPI0016774709|nr:DUF2637 domain-containing protein [Streptomyces viridodiastaticus]GHG33088.1 hypothetical protein GCM10018777_56390 [Streptomyces viridodiastaticus]